MVAFQARSPQFVNGFSSLLFSSRVQPSCHHLIPFHISPCQTNSERTCSAALNTANPSLLTGRGPLPQQTDTSVFYSRRSTKGQCRPAMQVGSRAEWQPLSLTPLPVKYACPEQHGDSSECCVINCPILLASCCNGHRLQQTVLKHPNRLSSHPTDVWAREMQQTHPRSFPIALPSIPSKVGKNGKISISEAEHVLTTLHGSIPAYLISLFALPSFLSFFSSHNTWTLLSSHSA